MPGHTTDNHPLDAVLECLFMLLTLFLSLSLIVKLFKQRPVAAQGYTGVSRMYHNTSFSFGLLAMIYVILFCAETMIITFDEFGNELLGLSYHNKFRVVIIMGYGINLIMLPFLYIFHLYTTAKETKHGYSNTVYVVLIGVAVGIITIGLVVVYIMYNKHIIRSVYWTLIQLTCFVSWMILSGVIVYLFIKMFYKVKKKKIYVKI